MTDHSERARLLRRGLVEVERQRREYEAVVAAGWRRRGVTYTEIGRRLGGLSGQVAKCRVLAGEELIEADPDGARAFVVGYLRTLFAGEDTVQKLARLVLADDPADALRAAARLVESQEAVPDDTP